MRSKKTFVKVAVIASTFMSVYNNEDKRKFDKKLTKLINSNINNEEIRNAILNSDIFFETLKKEVKDMSMNNAYIAYKILSPFKEELFKYMKVKWRTFFEKQFYVNESRDVKISDNNDHVIKKVFEWLESTSEDFDIPKHKNIGIFKRDPNLLDRVSCSVKNLKQDKEVRFLQTIQYGVDRNAIFEITFIDDEHYAIVINGIVGVFTTDNTLCYITDVKYDFVSNIEYKNGKFHAVTRHIDENGESYMALTVFTKETNESTMLSSIFNDEDVTYVGLEVTKSYLCTLSKNPVEYGDYGVKLDYDTKEIVSSLKDDELMVERYSRFLEKYPKRIGFRNVRDERFTIESLQDDGWRAYFFVSASGKTKQGIYKDDIVVDMAANKFFNTDIILNYHRENEVGNPQVVFAVLKHPRCFEFADIETHVFNTKNRLKKKEEDANRQQ